MTMYAHFVQCSDFAVCIVPCTRTVKRERHRAVSQHREFAIEQTKCGALFHPGRQNTDALQTVVRAQPDVVGTRIPGSDEPSGAASSPALVSRTTTHTPLNLTL